VIIQNVDSIAVTQKTSFGNGLSVFPVNEGEGREVILYNDLSVHTAYLMAFHCHDHKLTTCLKDLIKKHALTLVRDKGKIGTGSKLRNCGTIKNVRIGEYATLEGVTLLEEGTVNSSKEAPAYIGHLVNASKFIFSTGSNVSDGTYLRHCFVGQGCEIANSYTAENSVFFANSQCLQGEACSIFAGPYTVTHHKSTLLIAGYYSFFNAGSGTNQSNHMYKLGPVHQGIIERGGKTGSDSYVLWPAKIGAFTMILGRHYGNPDISELPFSYLLEDNGKSMLMPAQNLFSVGTVRDVQKWPKRDKRKGKNNLDFLVTEALNPFTTNKIIDGIKTLKQLQEKASGQSKTLLYKNTQISLTAINRGIKLYEQALIKYIGDILISTLKSTNFNNWKGEIKLSQMSDVWIDLGGLVCKKDKVNGFIDKLKSNRIAIAELNTFYKEEFWQYDELKLNHALNILKTYFNIDITTCSNDVIINFLQDYQLANNKVKSSIAMDAKKEFNVKSKIGFGIDGDLNTREADFLSIRGSVAENPFLIELEKEYTKLNQLAEEIIESLK
jgi:hypothetical protein